MLYQLVFRFILPIYRTTRQVKRGFRTMHERMNGEPENRASSKPRAKEKSKTVGDYIDFEEVTEK